MRLITLLIAALTDGLDGTIARLANQSTPIGAYSRSACR